MQSVQKKRKNKELLLQFPVLVLPIYLYDVLAHEA